MTRRGLVLILSVCAPALAQLPRSQAPMPGDTHTTARVDAVVTDLQGRPIAGLTADGFGLETDGKPRKILKCEFHEGEPLRLAVILDDLTLSLEHSNAARRALRAFVEKGLGSGEMAVLRTSVGTGALDRFTSDKREIAAAIDRARYHPAAEPGTPEPIRTGALEILRATLDGMLELPGRKAVLLISTFVREPSRLQLALPAHRASASIYAVNMGGPANAAQLDIGVAAAARETGGTVTDGGDVAKALARVAADQAAYYVLTFEALDMPFDYIARAPQVGRIELQARRPETAVRSRDGVYGIGQGEDYHEVEGEFERAIDSELIHSGIRARLTALVSKGAGWQVEALVHLEASDLTFVKGLDGKYRASVDTMVALYDESGAPVKDATRSFDAVLSERSFQRFQEHGFDYTVALPLPMEGWRQARVVLRDVRSGRTGSARQFVRASGWKDGKLALSSIVLHGETEKNADGGTATKDPLEAASIRRFVAGHRIHYAVNLFNPGVDKDKGSEIVTKSEMWRDGVQVFAGEPTALTFPPDKAGSGRGISGTIALGPNMAPGAYLFKLEVTDRIAPRTVTQWMDFEVRP